MCVCVCVCVCYLSFYCYAETGKIYLYLINKTRYQLTFDKTCELHILFGWDRSFLSVAWPTRVQLMFFFRSGFSVSYWALAINFLIVDYIRILYGVLF